LNVNHSMVSLSQVAHFVLPPEAFGLRCPFSKGIAQGQMVAALSRRAFRKSGFRVPGLNESGQF
ncbi:MAG: hypothetical protein ACR2FO_00475, partial [Actinomycetota bacterium]